MAAPSGPAIAMTLPSDCIDHLTRLAALELTADERTRVIADLDKIGGMIATRDEVETAGVEPLVHAVDAAQPLRADAATEAADPERCQRSAPSTADGLYLVPRVVE